MGGLESGVGRVGIPALAFVGEFVVSSACFVVEFVVFAGDARDVSDDGVVLVEHRDASSAVSQRVPGQHGARRAAPRHVALRASKFLHERVVPSLAKLDARVDARDVRLPAPKPKREVPGVTRALRVARVDSRLSHATGPIGGPALERGGGGDAVRRGLGRLRRALFLEVARATGREERRASGVVGYVARLGFQRAREQVDPGMETVDLAGFGVDVGIGVGTDARPDDAESESIGSRRARERVAQRASALRMTIHRHRHEHVVVFVVRVSFLVAGSGPGVRTGVRWSRDAASERGGALVA